MPVPFSARQTPNHRQNAGQFRVASERTGVRRLDHGPVGHGIAVGDAQFDQAAPAGGQPADHFGGEIQIGIAGGHKRHERLAAGRAKFVEKRVDGGHAEGFSDQGLQK